ncbi:MAG: hypothetical protein WEB58_12745 [Planctomycetaceae bacterium]
MDKKTKKQIEVLRTRLNKLQMQLAGARQQCDDPQEVAHLQRAVTETETELKRLRRSSV